MRQTRIRWLQTQDNFLKIGLTYSQLEVRISILLNLTVFHLEWRIQTTATWWCGEAFPLMQLQNIQACCQLSKTTFSNYLKKIVNKEVRQWLFPSFCEQPWSDFIWRTSSCWDIGGVTCSSLRLLLLFSIAGNDHCLVWLLHNKIQLVFSPIKCSYCEGAAVRNDQFAFAVTSNVFEERHHRHPVHESHQVRILINQTNLI